MTTQPPPYGQRECPAPPYNATNFTSANISTFVTLQQYARDAPNYPWNTGTDAQQIYRSNQNVSYFNGINQQTLAIKTQNNYFMSNFRDIDVVNYIKVTNPDERTHFLVDMYHNKK